MENSIRTLLLSTQMHSTVTGIVSYIAIYVCLHMMIGTQCK